jgi:hypothetical protein
MGASAIGDGIGGATRVLGESVSVPDISGEPPPMESGPGPGERSMGRGTFVIGGPMAMGSSGPRRRSISSSESPRFASAYLRTSMLQKPSE